jgi:hypothetical protein
VTRERIEALARLTKELQADLAQCYRLTGADPDGDSDAMLATNAVEEVRCMREDWDRAEAELVEAKAELVEAEEAVERRRHEEGP